MPLLRLSLFSSVFAMWSVVVNTPTRRCTIERNEPQNWGSEILDFRTTVLGLTISCVFFAFDVYGRSPLREFLPPAKVLCEVARFINRPPHHSFPVMAPDMRHPTEHHFMLEELREHRAAFNPLDGSQPDPPNDRPRFKQLSEAPPDPSAPLKSPSPVPPVSTKAPPLCFQPAERPPPFCFQPPERPPDLPVSTGAPPLCFSSPESFYEPVVNEPLVPKALGLDGRLAPPLGWRLASPSYPRTLPSTNDSISHFSGCNSRTHFSPSFFKILGYC